MKRTSLLMGAILTWSCLACTTLSGEPKKIEEKIQVSNKTTFLLTETISMPLLKEIAIRMTLSQVPVTLYIDSRGGDYDAAKIFSRFLEARRAKGLSTTCFAGPTVMSAAYYIFLHCDKRFVLKTTTLFPHKIHVWFKEPVNGPQLVTEGTQVIEEQSNWDGRARVITGMTEADYLAFRDSDNQFWSISKVELLSRNKWFEVVDGYILNLNSK
jgi:ATP-dependent protease ClpP protease subunit